MFCILRLAHIYEYGIECMVIVDGGDSIASTDIGDETVFISTRESYRRETER